jgi:1-aminocyclopropane-1-carboxylate deaminase/D-cysteine desulfhydrase-like pyridoxal-dependent ACC family enzyme
MWGFVTAMEELSSQLAEVGPVAAVWHAASSGGTTAGLALAADGSGIDAPPIGCSVDEDSDGLTARIEGIWRAAAEMGIDPPGRVPEVVDDHVGRGYGLATAEELAIQMEATRFTGLLFDPTYTGKALVGLRCEIERGRFGPDDRVVFWHTGGGFAVFAHEYPGL